MKSGTIRIDKPIGSFSVDDVPVQGIELVNVIAAVSALGADLEILTIEVEGPGGVAETAEEIYTYLAGLKPKVKIITNQTGDIASATTKPFLVGDERNAMQGKKFLIHNPWRETRGDAQAHAEAAIRIKQREDEYVAFYAERTGLKPDAIIPLMKNETGFDADTAVKLKFATGIKNEATKTIAYTCMKPKDEKTIGARLDAVLAMVENALKGKTLSMVIVNLQAGGAIAINAQDPAVLEGSEAWQVDTTGNPTKDPAADGDYPLQDGRVVSVAGGKVSKVAAAQPVAKAEIAPQVASLITEMETLLKGKTDIKATDLQAILAKVKTVKEEPKKETTDDDDEDPLLAFVERLEGIMNAGKEKSTEEKVLALVDEKIKAFKAEIKTTHKPKIKSFQRPADRLSPAEAYLQS